MELIESLSPRWGWGVHLQSSQAFARLATCCHPYRGWRKLCIAAGEPIQDLTTFETHPHGTRARSTIWPSAGALRYNERLLDSRRTSTSRRTRTNLDFLGSMMNP